MQLLELGAGPHGGHALGENHRLGDLEAEAGRRQGGQLQGVLDGDADAPVRQLLAGDVDPGDEGVRQQAGAMPVGGLTAGLAQDELAEREDQPGRLRERDELQR